MDPNDIQCYPSVADQPHRLRMSDFHPLLPPGQYEQALRQGYAILLPRILEAAPKGRSVAHGFMCFDLRPNAQGAYYVSQGLGLGLYPEYPIQHLIVALACPWRRLAILVEEELTPWSTAQVEDENRLLTLLGWTVFRVPYHPARLREEDILPDHLFEGHLGHFENPGDKEQYEGLLDLIRRRCLDGFLRWVKAQYFSPAGMAFFLHQHQPDVPAISATARPERETPEQEAERLMQAPALHASVFLSFARPPEPSTPRWQAFAAFARRLGLDTQADPETGLLTHPVTVAAWRAWQEASEQK